MNLIQMILAKVKDMQAKTAADKTANPTLYNTEQDRAAEAFKRENQEWFNTADNPNKDRLKLIQEKKNVMGLDFGAKSKEVMDQYWGLVKSADANREVQRKQNTLLETIAKGPEQPAPAPTIEDPNPSESAGLRRKKLAALRRGIQSTLTTGGQGLQGGGLVATPGASVMAQGIKKRLGE